MARGRPNGAYAGWTSDRHPTIGREAVGGIRERPCPGAGSALGVERLMANKTKATPQQEETREKGPETPDAPLPLLDLSNAAVTKIIKQAKKRGYVTHEQLNAVIPPEEVTSEQIEDILAALNEMGINVVETEEAEEVRD